MKKLIFSVILICVFGLVACNFLEEENSDMIQKGVAEKEREISSEVVDTDDEYADLQEESFKNIMIDLSNWKETYAEGDEVTPLKLKIVSEEENGVDWANDWYEQIDLSLPMIGDEWNRFYDEEYEYQWIGECLEIYERET